LCVHPDGDGHDVVGVGYVADVLHKRVACLIIAAEAAHEKRTKTPTTSALSG
jgi:hypothetical protein